MAKEHDADWRAQERGKADPSICASDLQDALKKYFKDVGYRNVQELVDLLRLRLDDKANTRVLRGAFLKNKCVLPLGWP